jgi:hypothetical protein
MSVSSHDSDCDCFACKIKTIQVSPKATPSRTRRYQSGLKDGNSWEKGTVQDSRGMTQLLPGTLEPMPIKKYVENRRAIEEGKRKMAQSTPQED